MFLDAIGSIFVYRSPTPEESLRSYLLKMPNSKLRQLAETNSHYAKATLVSMILEDKDNKTS